MNVTKYQNLIQETAIYPKNIGLAYCALGISDEAGEVTGKIKNSTEIHQSEMEKICLYWRMPQN